MALAAVLLLAGLYGVLPRLSGVHGALERASGGNVWWLAVAAACEVLSFAGYAALFRLVFGDRLIDWTTSVLITLAGVAATRVLATGGVGGIAFTVWVIRRSGRDARATTTGMTTFLLVLYAVYMLGLILASGGLLVGVLPGHAPIALTVTALILGAGVLLAVRLVGLIPGPARLDPPSRRRRAQAVAAGIPSGVRNAGALVSARDPLLLGALAWWAFDIAALAASLRAFGGHVPIAVLVLAYFMGMLGNLLPLPGGIGGVEGGMIGALIACGAAAGPTVGGVLAYRLVALWLPTGCGVLAYGALLGRIKTWPPVEPVEADHSAGPARP